MIKAMIFDLDGTLINSLEDIAYSVNCALRDFGYKERSLEEIRTFIGNGADMLIKRALPKEGQKDFEEVFKAYRDYYRQNLCTRTLPYEGISELLDNLRNAGIKTAVVTNKNDDDAKYIVNKLLGSGIDAVVGADLSKRKKKPDPEPVLLALDLLGVKKEESYYIGDSETDISTAENTGMKCIGCSWGYRGRDALKPCVFIAESPRDIYEFIIKKGYR